MASNLCASPVVRYFPPLCRLPTRPPLATTATLGTVATLATTATRATLAIARATPRKILHTLAKGETTHRLLISSHMSPSSGLMLDPSAKN
ncbi:unnamed protein product [Rhizoctonia solani]|uniref:Uncharacterized protein n=1 Tax=Rhizoctonia solani TaxID=456999 RepID=A0A8H3E8I8_9AGAM|nr:unnamed protein product [Rhizoctonia solani]